MKTVASGIFSFLLLLATLLHAQEGLPKPTIFMVNSDPDKYAGMTVYFDKAVLLGGTIRTGDDYQMQVGNDNLKKPDHLTFSISRKLSSMIAEEGRLPENHPVHLTCMIEKRGLRWHAHVIKVSLVTKDGKVGKIFDEAGPPPKGPPTIFMVNAEPEKYAGKTLVFDKAVLLGGTVRRGQQYEMQVANEKAAKPDNLSFSVSKKLVGKMAEHRLVPKHPVHLTCKIEQRGNRWYAEVTRIAIVGKDGKVTTTLED